MDEHKLYIVVIRYRIATKNQEMTDMAVTCRTRSLYVERLDDEYERASMKEAGREK